MNNNLLYFLFSDAEDPCEKGYPKNFALDVLDFTK